MSSNDGISQELSEIESVKNLERTKMLIIAILNVILQEIDNLFFEETISGGSGQDENIEVIELREEDRIPNKSNKTYASFLKRSLELLSIITLLTDISSLVSVPSKYCVGINKINEGASDKLVTNIRENDFLKDYVQILNSEDTTLICFDSVLIEKDLPKLEEKMNDLVFQKETTNKGTREQIATTITGTGSAIGTLYLTGLLQEGFTFFTSRNFLSIIPESVKEEQQLILTEFPTQNTDIDDLSVELSKLSLSESSSIQSVVETQLIDNALQTDLIVPALKNVVTTPTITFRSALIKAATITGLSTLAVGFAGNVAESIANSTPLIAATTYLSGESEELKVTRQMYQDLKNGSRIGKMIELLTSEDFYPLFKLFSNNKQKSITLAPDDSMGTLTTLDNKISSMLTKKGIPFNEELKKPDTVILTKGLGNKFMLKFVSYLYEIIKWGTKQTAIAADYVLENTSDDYKTVKHVGKTIYQNIYTIIVIVLLIHIFEPLNVIKRNVKKVIFGKGKSRKQRNKRTKNRKQNKRITKRMRRGRYTRR